MYKDSIFGATFDHFHLGHERLIDTAFELSEHVTIGLTKPIMYKNKFLAENIEGYTTREKNLKNYLAKKGFLNRATIISIIDIFGTTLKERKIDAIIATEENLANVILINKKRQEIGFDTLKTFIVPFVKAKDGKNITSERIRKGEVDRNGFVYKSLFLKKNLTLPDSLRPALQKPIGDVVKDTNDVLSLLTKDTIVIAVGDIVTSKLKEAGYNPAISIIDFKTRRESFVSQFLNANVFHSLNKKTLNAPGTINEKAANVIQSAFDKYFQTNKPQTVVIDGEEDLLALPAILLAPLNSIVLYGQFNKGIVINKVTEELKKIIRGYVEEFK